MHIINQKELSKNSLREKALLIAEAGYEAIDIERVVNRRIVIKNDILEIATTSGSGKNSPIEINLNNFKRVFLVGIGKGSALASATLSKILGDRLTSGIALDVQDKEVRLPKINRQYLGSRTSQKLKILTGTHPLPSKQNVAATQKIIELAKGLDENDLLITFICGGGSALLCGSEEELKHSQDVFNKLTEAGVDIQELNTIRKHLSEVKGGGLAKVAYPANVVSLIVSDVCGNDLSVVASGPTVFDSTTKEDVEKIIKKYQHKSADLSASISGLKETPKDKEYFEKVKNILFVCNQDAISTMAEKAKEFGFEPKIYSLALKGEAKEVLLPMIKEIKFGHVILSGGETTVTLKRKEEKGKRKATSKGGRNMEAVLGVINNQQSTINNLAILSFASDGHDNTEAAGAIADISTLKKAKELGINPQEFLDNHDSFHLFEKTRDLIFTDQKSFNVADLMIVLKNG